MNYDLFGKPILTSEDKALRLIHERIGYYLNAQSNIFTELPKATFVNEIHELATRLKVYSAIEQELCLIYNDTEKLLNGENNNASN